MNELKHMLEVNKAQKHYYEVASGGATSSANRRTTNLYRKVRARMLEAAAKEEHARRVTKIHKEWLGNVGRCKVLDLGCGSGNPLSFWLAERAERYVAIDLSESRIAALRMNLPVGENILAVAGDFLSDDFEEKDFDVVYALAVFHHFAHLREFCQKLKEKLKPGARIVTYDPLQTWLIARCLRTAYRPFQTDSQWEFPFTRDSLNVLREEFDVEACRGFYGKSKLALLVGLVWPSLGRKLALKYFAQEEIEHCSVTNINSCLHASFLLKTRMS